MAEAKINTGPFLPRTIPVIVILLGWIFSVGFTIHAGHHNRSVFLVLLFVGWVSSPFIGLLLACLLSRRWPVIARKALYTLMIFIPVCSVIGYSGLLSPAGMKPAFIFLVIPLISWILMAIVIPVAISKAGRKKVL